MLKSELVHIVAGRNPHLYLRDVENTVNTIFDEMIEALAEGSRVELRDVGSFCIRHRPARDGWNPKSGERVDVAEKWRPHFRPGKRVRDSLLKLE